MIEKSDKEIIRSMVKQGIQEGIETLGGINGITTRLIYEHDLFEHPLNSMKGFHERVKHLMHEGVYLDIDGKEVNVPLEQHQAYKVVEEYYEKQYGEPRYSSYQNYRSSKNEYMRYRKKKNASK